MLSLSQRDRATSSQKSGDVACRPKLLFINCSYWPDVEATGQLLTELCEDLTDEFDVTVLCGQPRAIVDDVPANALQLTERNGVNIRRIRHSQFSKRSFVGKLTNMVTFLVAATWSAFTAPRAEVVIVETDPPFLCLLGRALQLVRGSRLVCYLQDIYPDVAIALGKVRPGTLMRWLRAAFFRVYQQSDAVVVLSRDMRALLTDSGVPASVIHSVSNWVDTQAVFPVKEKNEFRTRHGLTDRFVVMYSGNMGLSQKLDQVLEAAGAVSNREEILFAMVGDGADRQRLEQLVEERKLTNVRFINYQPKDRLSESLSAADVHLVILRPEVKQLLMPSKLYGVLASGTPALVIADAECELASVVTQNDLGTVVSPDRKTELVEAVYRYANGRDVVQRQSQAARIFANRYCRRETSVAQIREILGVLVQNVSCADTTQVAVNRT